MGTDATGAGGNVVIVSTGSVVVQAPLQVTGRSTLGSTQATSLQVTGSSTLGSAQAASLQVLGTSTLGTTQAASLQVLGNSTLGNTGAASLQVTGSSTLGSTQVTSLQVLGISTLGSTQATLLQVTGSSTLGTTQAASLQVLGASTLASTQAASLQVVGSSTLGSMASDTVTVNAVANFTGGSTVLYGGSGVVSTPAVLVFQRRLSTSAVNTGTILGQVQFTGWDGAVNGLGAQIRSVFTVSLKPLPLINVWYSNTSLQCQECRHVHKVGNLFVAVLWRCLRCQESRCRSV